jgi:NADPH-dependent 2,4-dienoyl-CoA reductase/sulfur reductase-like enzyme
MKVIIIGGVAAGMSVAAKLRRLDESAEIVVYEKGNDLSYGACGMPYYIGGIIEEVSKLVARTKEEFEKSGINVQTMHEVIKLNATNKTIKVLDLKTSNTFETFYDILVIATGTKAITSNVVGFDEVKPFVLSQLEDAIKIKSSLDKVQDVAIIGGGYIGLEIAENLAHLNKKVHVIELQSQILPNYDDIFAKKAEEALKEMKIEFSLEERLIKYQKDLNKTVVITDKSTYSVDMVIEAIGVKPNTEFLRDSGIEMLKNGAIITNEFQETSLKDIYAAGDCSAYKHRLTNKHEFVPLGTHANKTGKVIAENIAGYKTSFPGIIGSNIIKINNLALAKTGLGYKEAKRLNLNYAYEDVIAKNQSGYYPGAKQILIRIVYDPKTGVLKGGQMIGEKGVSDRINILALAISKEMTAKEFSMLDFAYAPPFSPVWDPLLIAINQIKI